LSLSHKDRVASPLNDMHLLRPRFQRTPWPAATALRARACRTQADAMGRSKGGKTADGGGKKAHYPSFIQVRRAARARPPPPPAAPAPAAPRRTAAQRCPRPPTPATPRSPPAPQILNSDSATASPSVLLGFDSEFYLFNCGEGLQRLAAEYKVRAGDAAAACGPTPWAKH
jgi:hypothetical protein